jgi:hypothetical protein
VVDVLNGKSPRSGQIDPFNKKGFDTVWWWFTLGSSSLQIMKMSPLLLLPILLSLASVQASDRINVAEDEATHSAYNGGWQQGKNSGTGFGAWLFQSAGGVGTDSHCGFFVANSTEQKDLENAGSNGKALGMFANGVDFEVACAFRSFDAPLAVGDSFSLMMECGEFMKKFETDDSRPGVIGFSLRTGAAADAWDDLQNGSRLQFGFYQGEGNYQVFDGEADHDTGVPFTTGGVSVTVTLVTPDTYNLEITALDTKETKKLEGRKLAGDAGAQIDSFAIYNQDGESGDAYFNGFQVSRLATSLPR